MLLSEPNFFGLPFHPLLGPKGNQSPVISSSQIEILMGSSTARRNDDRLDAERIDADRMNTNLMRTDQLTLIIRILII